MKYEPIGRNSELEGRWLLFSVRQGPNFKDNLKLKQRKCSDLCSIDVWIFFQPKFIVDWVLSIVVDYQNIH